MNPRHLSFVLQVAKFESFSAAADACRVTQPTLSSGVHQTEVKLGATLFDRSTRRVTLTKFGRDILPAIEDVVSSTLALDRQAKALLESSDGLIRVGVSPIVDLTRVLGLLEPFRRSRKNLDFVFKECLVDDLEARLSDGRIDVAIWPEFATDATNQDSASLYLDPWVFLPNSAKLQCPEIGPQFMSDVAKQSFILTSGSCGLSQATQSMFEHLGLELVLYPGRALSYSAIEEWADLGLGAALLPASKVSRDRKGTVIPMLNQD